MKYPERPMSPALKGPAAALGDIGEAFTNDAAGPPGPLNVYREDDDPYSFDKYTEGIGSVPPGNILGDTLVPRLSAQMVRYAPHLKNGGRIDYRQASGLIQHHFNAVRTSKATGEGLTADDRRLQAQQYYESQRKPLRDRRAKILEQMLGPLPAKRIAIMTDIDKHQGYAALGAAIAAVIRGEDPGVVTAFLDAPIAAAQEKLDTQWQQAVLEREMRDKTLGIELGDIGQQFRDISTSERQELEDIRGEEEFNKKQEAKEKEFRRNLPAVLARTPDPIQLMTSLTAQGYQFTADEWALAHQEQDTRDRKLKADADIAEDKADILRQTKGYQVAAARLGNEKAEQDLKEAKLRFQYLPEELRSQVIDRHLKIKALRQSIRLNQEKFDHLKKMDQKQLDLSWAKFTDDQKKQYREFSADTNELIAEAKTARSEILKEMATVQGLLGAADLDPTLKKMYEDQIAALKSELADVDVTARKTPVAIPQPDVGPPKN